jgi:hypothetical protein
MANKPKYQALMRFGMTMADIGVARRKFSDQMHKADKRGIAFKFTFPEWMEWWINTGKWELRGNGKYEYCMSRYGDKGDYEPNNVFCNLNYNNCSDANKGRKNSDEVNAKKACRGNKNGFFGKTHTPEVKAKIKATWERKRIEKILKAYE